MSEDLFHVKTSKNFAGLDVPEERIHISAPVNFLLLLLLPGVIILSPRYSRIFHSKCGVGDNSEVLVSKKGSPGCWIRTCIKIDSETTLDILM
jgi:hypothetical protein